MDEIIVNKAFENHEEIVRSIINCQRSFLYLGYLLRENRQNKYYKALDYDTFEDYLGSPEVSIGRTWAYNLISIYELYSEKLGREEEELQEAKVSKLLAIRPVVEQNPDEWIGKAIHLSKSDLKKEVQAALGKSQRESPPKAASFIWSGAPELSSQTNYFEWLRSCPCLLCGKSPVDLAHFPRTRAAGGRLQIPLCRKHHQDYHVDPKEWTWKYRKNWESFFLTIIDFCFTKESEGLIENQNKPTGGNRGGKGNFGGADFV